MLVTWSKAAIKARALVLTIWIALTAFGLFGSSHLDQYLTTSLTVPGSASAAANEILNEKFKENTEGTFTVMYKYKQASAQEIANFKASVAQAARVIPGSEITNEKAFAGTLYSNIGTSFELKQAATYTKPLREALMSQGLTGAFVTGPPAIESDVVPILSSDLQTGQIIAVVLAAFLLIATLGFSWAVLIPLLFGLATISTTLGLIYLLAHKFLMVLYVPNIVELIGLGLAIDYSLLMVHRYRRELGQSQDPLAQTMKTAGRTAVISGITVAFKNISSSFSCNRSNLQVGISPDNCKISFIRATESNSCRCSWCSWLSSYLWLGCCVASWALWLGSSYFLDNCAFVASNGLIGRVSWNGVCENKHYGR